MFRIAIVGDKEMVSEISSVLNRYGATIYPSGSLRDCLEIHRIEKFDSILIQEQYAEVLEEKLFSDLSVISPHVSVIVILKKRDSDKALRWMTVGVHECLYEPLNLEEVNIVVKRTILAPSVQSFSDLSFFDRLFHIFSKNLFKKTAKISILILFAFLSVWGGQKIRRHYFYKTEVPKELPLSFKLPYSNPTGITWDGKNLLISDWSTQTVYKHKIDANMTLEKFFNTPDIPILSLTMGNGIVWSIGQDNNIRRHSINGQMISVSVCRLTGETPSALAWDGKNLWSCDAQTRKIYRHIPDENLTVVSAYNFPGKNPVGMVWEGNDLWIADEGNATILRLNFDGRSFTLMETLHPGMHSPGTNRLSGITFDGDNFWTISEGNGMLFRHPLNSFKGGKLQ